MDIRLTSEQKIMQEMVRNFAQKEIKPKIAQMEAGHFPSEIIQKMGALGLMGIPFSENYGGAGMDFTSYIIAIHEISKVSATVGVILSVHTSVATNPIVMFGTEAQKEHYVKKLTDGTYLGAFALTESSAGSDAASLKTSAKRVDDHYILKGSKMFITNGKEADIFIVFAKTDREVGTKGITAFIVEADTPGLSVGKNERKMGLHGTSTVALNFEQCKVPVSQRLGEEGAGFQIAMANLNVGRIGIAAQALGIAEGAFDYAVSYAKEREQFGKPIAHNQAISFKLADMKTAVEAATLLVYNAAALMEKGIECRKEVSMAKLLAAQTARKNAIEAVQVLGGYGYTTDYEAERFFRDAKVTEIYEGTNEIQKIVIAKQLLQ